MTECACRLDGEQRDAVERQIAETCAIRGWELHAVNCRSNHAHVVVTANQSPKSESLEATILYVRDGQDNRQGK